MITYHNLVNIQPATHLLECFLWNRAACKSWLDDVSKREGYWDGSDLLHFDDILLCFGSVWLENEQDYMNVECE